MENITKVLFGLLLPFMLVFAGAATPVTDGLIVYYDGNLSGNSLVDLSGNNNIGYVTSVTSGTNQSTGASYINLNGVNSKIDISNNAQTNISSPVANNTDAFQFSHLRLVFATRAGNSDRHPRY